MSDNLKSKAIVGIVWSCVERFSVQGIQFFIMIIMARLLSPKDYGLVGMVSIFIAIAQSLVDSGFSQALIRKNDRTEIDNSTVFYFNLAVGIFLYFMLFLISPFVAVFYKSPELTNLMRVVSLSVVFNSFIVVQLALLAVNLDFKTLAKSSLSASILSGVVGILLAIYGYGCWAIVSQQLTHWVLYAILIWLLSGWRPIKTFSWKSFKDLFSFGSKLMFSGLLDVLYRNMYLMVIGKVFSAQKLGLYTRANQFAEFPSSNLTGVLQRVTYPVLCKIKDDKVALSAIYRKFLRLSAFLIFPLLIGLSAVSKPLVLLILKEQWLFAADLLKIICFAFMWYPIHAINLNLLQVEGRSDLFLRLEIIKKIISVSILLITLHHGLIIMCYGMVLSSIIALIINTYYTGKIIKVGFIMQMRDLFPILLLSLSMWGVVNISMLLIDDNLLKLLIAICVGGIYYIIMSLVFRFSELKEIRSIIIKK